MLILLKEAISVASFLLLTIASKYKSATQRKFNGSTSGLANKKVPPVLGRTFN